MNSNAGQDETELLERYQRGDQEAARLLFDQYASRLIGIVEGRLPQQLRPRMDAEDVVQSAYRSFFRIAMRGDVRLEETGDLWRLLVAIALNKLRLQTRYHVLPRSPESDRFASQTAE
jgi:RNA polymerase sigma-70 factor (ECF subfamily)